MSRHCAAVALALCVNLALVAVLASRGGRAARMLPRQLETVPLEIVPAGGRPRRAVRPPRAPVHEQAQRSQTPAPPAPPAIAMPRLEPAPAGLDSMGIGLPPYDPGADPAGVALPDVPVAKDGAALSEAAALIQPPDLSLYYPYRARLRGITGTTRLRLQVGADGRVGAVEVLSSAPAGVFEAAAGRVGRSLRFRPALKRGEAAASSVELSLVWRLE